jgi:hypothetical protein
MLIIERELEERAIIDSTLRYIRQNEKIDITKVSPDSIRDITLKRVRAAREAREREQNR